MRKILILLLVVGFLIGTFAVMGEAYHVDSPQSDADFPSDEVFEDNLGVPAPCDGGGGDGGPSVPG